MCVCLLVCGCVPVLLIVRAWVVVWVLAFACLIIVCVRACVCVGCLLEDTGIDIDTGVESGNLYSCYD